MWKKTVKSDRQTVTGQNYQKKHVKAVEEGAKYQLDDDDDIDYGFGINQTMEEDAFLWL